MLTTDDIEDAILPTLKTDTRTTAGLSRDCPCEPPKRGYQTQRQPNGPIKELVETVGFVRKTEDGREADFRLANRRLQPIGHLTADAKCYVKSGLACSHFSSGEAAVFQTGAFIKFDGKIA